MFDFEKDYRKAMDDVQFSVDFEKRALEHVLKEKQSGGYSPMNRVKRTILTIGATAAALIITLTALRVSTPPLSDEKLVSPIDINSNEVVMSKMPEMAAVSEADAPQQARLSMVGQGDVRYTESETDDYYDTAAMPMEAVATMMPDRNTAEYNFIKENGFQKVATAPLSTFAADVDTASYANVRRMLLEGKTPPPDAVRIEEFINYFHYDYPEPKDGDPFSVTTELVACPWNSDSMLLSIALQAKKIDADRLPRSNLVFLVDVSGSMDMPDKLPLAQKAFQMVVDNLKDEDTISIVTYAGEEAVILDGVNGKEKVRIREAIDHLFAGGSTAGAKGILTAYELARKHFISGGNNRVILATDGDMNVGITSEGELTRLIESEKQSGVFLSVMGFGTDNLKDNKLEALADHGDGNYSYIDSTNEAKKVLIEEMGGNFFTVAKDVKLQVEFNPAMVSAYRLIGYENRTMASEDFANDQKDGGEIGAGHSVMVLYEVKTGTAQNELKYQSALPSDSRDYATVSVRAKKPDENISELWEYPITSADESATISDNLRFAAAVAEVGMLLRDSEFKNASSYKNASELLDSISNLTQDPYKDEFAYMVRKLSR